MGINFDQIDELEDIFSLKLTQTTLISDELCKSEPWLRLAKLYGAKQMTGTGHILKNVTATIYNGAMTHGKSSFLLSKDLINNLIKNDKNIKRGELSGGEYHAFMRLAKEHGILVEKRKPTKDNGKNQAGLYQVGCDEIIIFIEKATNSDSKFLNDFNPSPEYEIGFVSENETVCEMANEKKTHTPLNLSEKKPKEENLESVALKNSIMAQDQTSCVDYSLVSIGPHEVKFPNVLLGPSQRPDYVQHTDESGTTYFFKNYSLALTQALSGVLGPKVDTFKSFTQIFREKVEFRLNSDFGQDGQPLQSLWPTTDQVMDVVDELLKVRFSEKDLNENFKFSGKYCREIRSECLKAYEYASNKKSHIEVPTGGILGEMPPKPFSVEDEDFLKLVESVGVE